MKNSKFRFIIYFSVSALLFSITSKANAQSAEFGLRFMPTVSALDMKTSSGGTVSGQATFGYGVGAFLGYNFSNHVGIQGEVIYSSIMQKYKEQDVERKIKLKYVNIPLLLSLNTNKTGPINFNVVAGPQIGISVGSSVSTSGGNESNTNAIIDVKKGDLGLAYGAGADFALSSSGAIRLGLGFRGVYGLFDISDNNNSTTTNSYYILDRTHLKTYSAYAGLSIVF